MKSDIAGMRKSRGALIAIGYMLASLSAGGCSTTAGIEAGGKTTSWKRCSNGRPSGVRA